MNDHDPTDPEHQAPGHEAPGHEPPDTVTEAIDLLRRLGYSHDLDLCNDGLSCAQAPGLVELEAAVIDHRFRFEGDSDPADESIVLGITCTDNRWKGVLVSAFGPSADPAHARMLRALAAGQQLD